MWSLLPHPHPHLLVGWPRSRLSAARALCSRRKRSLRCRQFYRLAATTTPAPWLQGSHRGPLVWRLLPPPPLLLRLLPPCPPPSRSPGHSGPRLSKALRHPTCSTRGRVPGNCHSRSRSNTYRRRRRPLCSRRGPCRGYPPWTMLSSRPSPTSGAGPWHCAAAVLVEASGAGRLRPPCSRPTRRS